MGLYFEYDRLIDEKDICNYKKEKELITSHVNAGDCLKIYGLRNVGKTSLIKNVIAKKWEKQDLEKRIVIYIDLYSVESFEDISFEFTNAFNIEFSKKKNIFRKGLSWFKLLRNIRPTWKPPTDSDNFGEFSIHTEQDSPIVDFRVVLENINRLNNSNKFQFFIILDEFQEISKIKSAEAKLRSSLQKLSDKIPIVVMGSKYHLLQEIFDKPKAPFHSWGMTVELKDIKYNEYHKYMNSRFKKANKEISFESSKYLQDIVNRIPEAINRFCEFIVRDEKIKKITSNIIDQKLLEFIDRSRSIYIDVYSSFNKKQKEVLKAIAIKNKVISITGKEFLSIIPNVSKSGVNEIVKRFLDESVIYHLNNLEEGEYYIIADPFLRLFILNYKVLS